MDDLESVAKRLKRQRRAADRTYAELKSLIIAERQATGRKRVTLRTIAAWSGLTFARIYQIERDQHDRPEETAER